MWEYKVVYEKFRFYIDLVAELNKLGKEGWEMVSYYETIPEKHESDITTRIIFKREKLPT